MESQGIIKIKKKKKSVWSTGAERMKWISTSVIEEDY